MRVVIILALFLFSIGSAETLEEVLKLAEENSPALKSNFYQVKSLEGNIKQAKALPNPQLYAEFGRLVSQTDSAPALTSFSITQNLRLWGERKLAVKSAVLQKKAQEYFFLDQKNLIFSQIYQLFYNAVYQRELLKIKKQQLKMYQDLYKYLEKGNKLGEFTKLDLLRAKRNLFIASTQVKNQQAKYTASLKELESLIGVKLKGVEGEISEKRKLADINLENLPIFRYYQLLINSLDTQIKRQKALAKPQVAVGVVVSEDEVDLGKYDAGLSINFTVPVFNKNQGQVINLTYQKKAVIEKERLTKVQIQNRLTALKTQIETVLSQIKVIEEKTIPEVKTSLELAEKSFKNRVITFFEFSSIQSQYFDTIKLKADLYFQYHQLIANYIRIGGLR